MLGERIEIVPNPDEVIKDNLSERHSTFLAQEVVSRHWPGSQQRTFPSGQMNKDPSSVKLQQEVG